MPVAPVSFRLAHDDLALIDRAASLKGRSRTEFVRDAAIRQAEEALLDAAVIRLTPEDFAAIDAHLGDPGKPSAALQELMARRPPWREPV